MKATLPENQSHLVRLKRLLKALKNVSLDACLIEHPLELFYFTGLKLSAGRLLVHPQGSLLLVDSRYLQVAEKQSPYETSLDTSEAFLNFCTKHQIRQLGFDGRHTSYDHYLRLKTWQAKSEVEFISATAILKTIRSIKDHEEITKMKKSAALLWKGFEFIQDSLKEGVIEKELAKRFEIFCLEHGAERMSFEPIIAFGANTAMPHYRAGNDRLKAGIVLIDIGIVVDHYHSDMTRVIFFKKEDPFLRGLYEIVKHAQSKALELCRPGIKIKELDLAARQVMREKNVEHLFAHSLGHGIGLETHEYPRIKFDNEDKDETLESGMVFTIEPGLYVPGIGGVRYEDTVLITTSGYQNFYG